MSIIDSPPSVGGSPMRTATPRPSLRFDTTVARELVHRNAVAEVFVTDAAPLGDDRFLIAAQLPRSYGFYNDGPRNHYDPLLVMESVRQGTVFAAHQYHGVPRDHAFVVRSIDLQVTDVAAHRIGPRPGRQLTEVDISAKEYRHDALASMTIRASSVIDDVLCSRGTGAFSFMPSSVYRQLRQASRDRKPGRPTRHTPSEAADPRTVGRHDRRNVVITPLRPDADSATTSCDLVVDVTHPSLFDHPLDHLPGMLLLEAFQQTARGAASAMVGAQPTDCTVTRCAGFFNDFAELDLRTTCTAIVNTAGGSDSGRVIPFDLAIRQAGVVVATGRVDITVTA